MQSGENNLHLDKSFLMNQNSTKNGATKTGRNYACQILFILYEISVWTHFLKSLPSVQFIIGQIFNHYEICFQFSI